MTDTVTYNDEDLVYVNPKKKQIVSAVNWTKDGNVEPLEMVDERDEKHEENDEEEKPKGRYIRKKKTRYYPWGTYRTMKKLYRIEGKERDTENYIDLNKAIDLSMEQPYWE
ncbi:MAG: hypothetical protein O2904_00550 [bacterium]|nr:hypothetical protein [bacterium]